LRCDPCPGGRGVLWGLIRNLILGSLPNLLNPHLHFNQTKRSGFEFQLEKRSLVKNIQGLPLIITNHLWVSEESLEMGVLEMRS
jgi:hypothetical protein